MFEDKKGLEKVLKSGEERILEHPDLETVKGTYNKKVRPDQEKCLSRDEDASLSFLYQTEKLSKDVEKDSAKKLLYLKKLTKSITRPNGAIRYKGDEYLNLDYHTLKNQWTDNKKTNEAEWFLVSEIANAYGSIAGNLLNHVEKTGEMSGKTQKLLKMAINGETEYINRSYARITPKNMTKSNHYSCPSYRLPDIIE